MTLFIKKKGFGNIGLKYDYRLIGLSIFKITRHIGYDRVTLLSFLTFRIKKATPKSIFLTTMQHYAPSPNPRLKKLSL